MNLYGNEAYNGDPIWTDLHNLAWAWSGTATPLTADGYPLASSSTAFNLTNYPDGNYQFSYTGTATVAFSDIGQLAGPVTVAAGVTTGTVIVNHQTGDGTLVSMQVSGIDPAHPMDNFHLMMPGYGNGTTPEPMYTPAFVQCSNRSRIFGSWAGSRLTIRTLTNWSDRVGPNSFITDGSGGIPYEDMIELCNEVAKGYVDQHSGRWPRPSSCKAWRSSSTPIWTPTSTSMLSTATRTGTTESTRSRKSTRLPRTIRSWPPAVRRRWSSSRVRTKKYRMRKHSNKSLRPTVPRSDRSWPALRTPYRYQRGELQFIQQTYGTPSQFIYATAVAPYISLPTGDNVAGLTLDGVFADLNQYLTTSLVPAIQADATLAAQYGLPLVAYEGGQSLWPGANYLNYVVMTQWQNDPRMHQLYVSLLNDWQQAGGALYVDAGLAAPGYTVRLLG